MLLLSDDALHELWAQPLGMTFTELLLPRVNGMLEVTYTCFLKYLHSLNYCRLLLLSCGYKSKFPFTNTNGPQGPLS